ncbi:hypothetical protein [cyanobacterium endosymbiont of Epithemia turgida]|nr:hypothetical protein [cyanobacterium endosymbiont of Epithemia turgida]BAP18024.1 hypothetical protein ETSB_1269 [cyanobacterium endosymbiont of Epithemia turgida isolate EtSB Lake Yunoko]
MGQTLVKTRIKPPPELPKHESELEKPKQPLEILKTLVSVVYSVIRRAR